ncbi:MAG: GNAT family N-acetyltransferase [Clostridia bacterium]|nr:GNAT family N-acetyltransferase [Clostridia bacterium]
MEEIKLQIMTRPLCHALFQAWKNDPAIYADMSKFTPYRYDPERVNRYFDRLQEPNRVVFAVMLGERPIGEAQLKRIDRERGECVLSIHLQNDAVKGKGYGTAAERLAVRYAFDTLGMRAVLADCVRKNTRSRHVLEKVGFRRTGEEGDFFLFRCERD